MKIDTMIELCAMVTGSIIVFIATFLMLYGALV